MSSCARVLLVGLLLTCGVIWYVDAAGEGKLYGPLQCRACGLANPQADKATATFLAVWERKVASPPLLWTQMIVNPGDTVLVCNRQACVRYTKTDSGQYTGGAAVPQSSGPGVGNGGGGGSGGGRSPGGGSIGGGGCIGKCTGTVTVGGAKPVRR